MTDAVPQTLLRYNGFINNDVSKNTLLPLSEFGNESFKQAIFDDNRSANLIEDPHNWEVAVERFSLPACYLPYFWSSNTLGSFSPLLLFIKCPTTVAGGKVYSVDITQFLLSDGFITPFSSALFSLSEDLRPSLDAKDIQAIETLLIAVSWGLNSLVTQIVADGNGGALDNKFFNQFIWDPSIERIKFVCQNLVFWPGSNGISSQPSFADNGLYKIYFGGTLSKFFSGFHTSRDGSFLTIPPLDTNLYGSYLLWVTNTKLNVFTQTLWPASAQTTYLLITAESDNLFNWDTVQRITVTTNLPINVEYTRSENSANFAEALLTDFLPVVFGNQKTNDVYQYFNNGNLRWITMSEGQAIKDIRIQFFVEFNSGIVVPLLIPANSSASMKLVFRTKNYRNGNSQI